MVSEDSGRRRFIRKLTTLGAAGGIATLLYGRVTEKPLIQLAQAASGDAILIDETNNGNGTTELDSNTSSVGGMAFLGRATAGSGNTIGVWGQSDSPEYGIGVFGFASAGSGGTTGVEGQSMSPDGTGVFGWANSGSGTTYGVRGLSNSPDGMGVYGVSLSTTSSAGIEPTGVYGEAKAAGGPLELGPWPHGVEGYASGTSGVTTGVYGHANSPDGIGVQGNASATTGYARGVYGTTESPYGVGVQGIATTGHGNGVSGYSPEGAGVWGMSGWTGVVGLVDSPNATGVAGLATEDSAVGVYGLADSPNGRGVVGWSNGIGVEGRALAPGALPFRAMGASGQTASLQEWQNTSGTALGVVDANGRLGLGTDSPLVPLHIKSASSNPAIMIENENSHVGEFIYCYSNGNIPFFSGRRARGTIASPSAVQADDTLMRYGGSGYGSTSFPGGNRAILEFRAAETWTDSTQGTYIILSTTPTGSTGTAERMRITADGSILPPSDNTGSIGVAGQSWASIKGHIMQPGDLVFENNFTVTEDELAGLAFKNDAGEKIAVLDREGNFHIKGDIIKDL